MIIKKLITIGKAPKEVKAALLCPACESDRVTLAHIQEFMANTLEHYCHSVKTPDADSPARCLACDWRGQHNQLKGYPKYD